MITAVEETKRSTLVECHQFKFKISIKKALWFPASTDRVV